jgi:hypothetical protein
MAQTNDHKSHDVFGTISTLSLLIAIGVTSIVSMLRIVDHMRPSVGDIIEFDATKIVAQDSEPRLEVKPVDPSGVALCTLDVQRMRQSNGSLMIEAMRPDPIFNYRVHWAGGPTSEARSSCGISANLLLSEVQITRLKMAAGR